MEVRDPNDAAPSSDPFPRGELLGASAVLYAVFVILAASVHDSWWPLHVDRIGSALVRSVRLPGAVGSPTTPIATV